MSTNLFTDLNYIYFIFLIFLIIFCITCSFPLLFDIKYQWVKTEHNYKTKLITFLYITTLSLIELSLYFEIKKQSVIYIYQHGICLQLNVNNFWYQFVGILLIIIYLSSILYLKLKVRTETIHLIYLLSFFVFSLFTTTNFLGFILSFEGVSFVLYILASVGKKQTQYGKDAGAKYLMIGLFSSALLIFGLSLLYAFTGISEFKGLLYFIKNTVLLATSFKEVLIYNLSFILILLGFFFKISASPFHNWIIDLYKNMEDNVVFFFAIFTKTIIIMILLKEFCFLFESKIILTILYAIGWCSIFTGVFSGLTEEKIKGIIAYSSISNIGYILIALSLHEIYFKSALITALAFIFIYCFTVFNLFCILFKYKTLYKNENFVQTINELESSNTVNKNVSFSLYCALLSLIGLPPFIGFGIKLYLIGQLISANLFYTAFTIFVFSVLAAFFYIKLIKNVYFIKKTKQLKFYPTTDSISFYSLNITALFLIFFFNSFIIFIQTHFFQEIFIF